MSEEQGQKSNRLKSQAHVIGNSDNHSIRMRVAQRDSDEKAGTPVYLEIDGQTHRGRMHFNKRGDDDKVFASITDTSGKKDENGYPAKLATMNFYDQKKSGEAYESTNVAVRLNDGEMAFCRALRQEFNDGNTLDGGQALEEAAQHSGQSLSVTPVKVAPNRSQDRAEQDVADEAEEAEEEEVDSPSP